MDLGVLGAAFALAYLLRFEFSIPAGQLKNGLTQLPFVVLVQFSCLVIFGVYSFIWRYIGMTELLTFVRAAVAAAVPMLALRFLLPDSLQAWRIPLSITIMDTVFAFGGVLGLRVLRRGVYERFEKHRGSSKPRTRRAQRALLVGAGQAGLLAARDLIGDSRTDLEVVGFIDDDPRKVGTVIVGVKVLGTTEDLPGLIEEYSIDRVVITMVKAPREVLRGLMTTLRRLGVSVQIMPALHEILEGRVSVSRFREVQIEDLLGREAVKLDETEISGFIAGRAVMVTGAGGSIGSELARQVARFEPGRLLLLERAESALFSVHRELSGLWPDLAIEPIVANVTEVDPMRRLLARTRPEIVLHAAAHKHVPLMERDAAEAVRNNSLGSYHLARLAAEAEVEAFVMISTDKAVRPTSVMGASKRLAEVLLHTLQGQSKTRFSTVRFGNVLGSSGSVIPIFRQQIEMGGPVTVTHPEMVRYFMTIPEASQLVLQAAAMGRGGELFLLDMGEPVKILDLARDMIRLAGVEPDEDIEIAFTGTRPGEKLYEELNYEGEDSRTTKHPKISAGRMDVVEGEEFAAVLDLLWAGQADPAELAEVRAEVEALLEIPATVAS